MALVDAFEHDDLERRRKGQLVDNLRATSPCPALAPYARGATVSSSGPRTDRPYLKVESLADDLTLSFASERWHRLVRITHVLGHPTNRRYLGGVRVQLTPGWVLCTCGPYSVAGVALQT